MIEEDNLPADIHDIFISSLVALVDKMNQTEDNSYFFLNYDELSLLLDIRLFAVIVELAEVFYRRKKPQLP